MDVSQLEPQLDVTVDSKLESALETTCQKQMETNLQIHTIIGRLDAYMIDINQRIESVEDKLLIAIRKDVKKMMKNKVTKGAKEVKGLAKMKDTISESSLEEKEEIIDLEDIDDETDLLLGNHLK